MMHVGLIGVGMMGHGIAKNIVRKGFLLNYLRHVGNQPTADLDAAGAQGWDSAGDLTAACDVIILCVTGSAQVEEIVTGAGNITASLRPGSTVIDCSTARPTSTVAIAGKVMEKGARFMDAAMTRTPKEAEEGRLNLLVGADPQVLEEMRPLLQSFSENIVYAGGVGTGHQLKLLHNFVSLGSATLIAEAVACAIKGGILKHALVECLATGGGKGITLDRLQPYILEGQTEQFRFTIANASKDLRYYLEMTADLRAADQVARSVGKTLDDLVQRGVGEAFMPEQIDLL